MALVLTRQIIVGGTPTTFYVYGSEPVENEATDDRGRNVVVRFEDIAGNPITVRQVDVVGGSTVLTEVTTLTTSPINGRLPTFYAAEGGVAMITDVDYQVRWSPGYLNLVQELQTAAQAALAAQQAAEAAAALAAAGGGGGGGGGVSVHSGLAGLGADDHLQYARTDGSRGAFATPGHSHTGFATSADLSSTSTADRTRSNHTGTQAIGTVVGLQAALDSKQVKFVEVTTLAEADAAPDGTVAVVLT